MDSILGTFVAVILSFACGLRATIPLLAFGIAANTGILHISSGMQWMAHPVTMVVLILALILESLVYFIPGLDSVVDVLIFPCVILAGILMTGASLAEMTPVVKWGFATIVGGGAAGSMHVGMSTLRGFLLVSAAGLGNWLLSLIEIVAAFILVALAIVVPVLALIFLTLVVGAGVGVYCLVRK